MTKENPMTPTRAAPLVLILSALPLLAGGDAGQNKTPFMLKRGYQIPQELERELTLATWQVGYIGCSDPSLASPGPQADQSNSAFLLRGMSGTAIYVSDHTAVSKLLQYRGNVQLPGPLGTITCYVYAEKPGAKLWYFATSPAPGPAHGKFFAISYADTSQPRPTLTPFTWAMQTNLTAATTTK
jgi:hypothetical protein